MENFNFWAFIETNVIGLATIGVLIYFLAKNKSTKKIKFGAGGIEVENQTDADKFEVIDPQDKCPYDKAYTEARSATRKVQGNLDEMEKSIGEELREIRDIGNQLISDKKESRVNQLKMLFHSRADISDRVLAGLEYISLKENGLIRKDTIGMSIKYPDIYNTVCAMKPEYRVPEVEEALAKREG